MGLEPRNFYIPTAFKYLSPPVLSPFQIVPNFHHSLLPEQVLLLSQLPHKYQFIPKVIDQNPFLSARQNHSSSSTSDNPKRQKRNLNIGNAIRILSDDIPGLLQKSYKPDYSIFSDNVKFVDRTHSLSLQGLIKYQMLWKFGKRMVSFIFKEHQLEITKMSMLNDSTLAVRWRFVGTKRMYSGLFGRFTNEHNANNSSHSAPKNQKTVEGYSYYKFNEEGFVKEHVLDQIEPPLQRWNTLKAWFWWIGRLPDTSFQHQCKQDSQ